MNPETEVFVGNNLVIGDVNLAPAHGTPGTQRIYMLAPGDLGVDYNYYDAPLSAAGQAVIIASRVGFVPVRVGLAYSGPGAWLYGRFLFGGGALQFYSIPVASIQRGTSLTESSFRTELGAGEDGRTGYVVSDVNGQVYIDNALGRIARYVIE